MTVDLLVAISGVVGLVLGSSLTVVGSSWVADRQHRHQQESAAKERRLAAYLELLSTSARVTFRADALSLEMQVRSGLKEGIDVLTRQRKLVDPLEMYDWWARDFDTLLGAADRVWLEGSSEAITLANDIVSTCSELLKIATQLPERRSAVDRFKSVKWSAEQAREWDSALKRLAKLRADFTSLVRRDLGQPVVDVLELHTDKFASTVNSRSPEVGQEREAPTVETGASLAGPPPGA